MDADPVRGIRVAQALGRLEAAALMYTALGSQSAALEAEYLAELKAAAVAYTRVFTGAASPAAPVP